MKGSIVMVRSIVALERRPSALAFTRSACNAKPDVCLQSESPELDLEHEAFEATCRLCRLNLFCNICRINLLCLYSTRDEWRTSSSLGYAKTRGCMRKKGTSC